MALPVDENRRIDQNKMQNIIKDLFSSITVLGKERLSKNYIFIPAETNECQYETEKPFEMKVELFAYIDEKWKKYDCVHLMNDTVDVIKKENWALIETQESYESIKSLSNI